MATSIELETRIRTFDWPALRLLWKEIQSGSTPGWDEGKALEYLVLRAFELDKTEPVVVRYPYRVELFGETVEEIDGAVHLPGLSFLVESKDWGSKAAFGPIAKMRNQLLRRPSGTFGVLFSKEGFTQPAVHLAHFVLPQAILLWSGEQLSMALEEGAMCRHLRLKHRICTEYGIPDYNIGEANIQ